MKKKKNKANLFINIILILGLCCGLSIVGYHKYSNYTTVQLYSSLADSVSNKRVQNEQNKSDSFNASAILPQYLAFYEQNNDLIGWIYIDGTNIDFPVMYTKEADYYARRNFNKHFSDYGSIWLDECNTLTADTRDNNLLIYGHNIWQENTMFSGLHGYEEKSYYDAHPIIHFDSIYEECTYDVIAAVRTEVLMSNDEGFRYYYFRGYHNEKEFNEYMNFLSSKKLYDTVYTLNMGMNLLHFLLVRAIQTIKKEDLLL